RQTIVVGAEEAGGLPRQRPVVRGPRVRGQFGEAQDRLPVVVALEPAGAGEAPVVPQLPGLVREVSEVGLEVAPIGAVGESQIVDFVPGAGEGGTEIAAPVATGLFPHLEVDGVAVERGGRAVD